MAFVTLVRHGQANGAARDEAGYDRLSELGWQQARWLGAHFREAGEVFARVYSGTLRRHVETAEAIDADCGAPVMRDERLNELEYFAMAQALHDQHGVPVPGDREEFVAHLPQLFEAWRAGRIEGVRESFETFETRVGDALREIADGQGRALVVTSGGLIGMAMRIVLGLDMRGLAHMCLAIENTSVHRLQPLPTGLAITQFNALPHLDSPARARMRSHL
jgi:broad specificity phosphatase PhoE